MPRTTKEETERRYRWLLDEQARSGLSLRAFADERGIAAGTLSYWKDAVLTPRLLVTANYDGAYNLWSVSLDGTDRVKLTDNTSGYEFLNPRVSSNGSQILLTSVDTSLGSRGNGRLFLANADGTGFREILTDVAHKSALAADWMPDGQSFVLSVHTGADNERHQLYRASIDAVGNAAELTQLTFEDSTRHWHQASSPDVSADGDRIVFTGAQIGTRAKVFEYDMVTGDVTLLAAQPATNLEYPRWSPDGTKIVLNAQGGTSPSSIQIMAADGSGRTTLNLGIEAFRPVFVSDNAIAFLSHTYSGGVHVSTHMYTANLDGSNLTQLTYGDGVFHRAIDFGMLPTTGPAVPEPGTSLTLLAAMSGVVAARRRSRRSSV